MPASGIGDSAAGAAHQLTPSSVEVPAGRMLPDWRQAFDFHNSPAPWILIAILVLYGWLHVGHREAAGRDHVESIAQLLLLLLVVALVLNVANGTWRQWLAAKFLGA
jgi:protein-S-isoprenylcysteine O-methyltransferase Ste14